MGGSVTYKELRERNDDITARLERIAYRLRQGAISDEGAAALLTEIAEQLNKGWDT